MSEQPRHRGRRLVASAAATVLAVLGVTVTSYAMTRDEPAPPTPPAPQSSPRAEHTAPNQQPAPAEARTPAEPGEYRRPVGPVMAASAPVHVDIPGLDVSTPTIRLGLQDDGTMEVPTGPGKAGWYDGSPTPGELGPSVIAGHVTWDRSPDVFFALGRMKPGQRVEVRRRDDSTSVFEVTKVAQYPKADFPTRAVYGNVDHAALRLITCGGVFDGEDNRYLDNVVVYARLVRAVRG